MPHEDPRDQCTNILPGHTSGAITATRLREVADWMDGSEQMDIYGEGAYLAAFEEEVAGMFGKDAAVFMPSGTMAQQIALRLWCEQTGRPTVAMHPTSHLEFAEHLGYQYLHDLRRVQFGGPEFVQDRMLTVDDFRALPIEPGAILLELPYRPLGGQLPQWDDLLATSQWARERGIPIHLDGARIWQCQSFYNADLDEIAGLFDSLYVSFYKDLGGLCGCMLIGPEEFIAASRVWQRRYGGNLFTQAPYVASARMGLEKNLPQLPDWVERARDVAAILNHFPQVRTNPNPPHVNFFQLFIEGDPQALTEKHHEIARDSGTYLFGRLSASAVPGFATTEMHMFGNAMQFDLDTLAPFMERLLA
jgi:threonine aldolase